MRLSGGTPALRWTDFRPDTKMFVYGSREIDRNELEIKRPFESGAFAGGFNFSHGHFILNAGYDKDF